MKVPYFLLVALLIVVGGGLLLSNSERVDVRYRVSAQFEGEVFRNDPPITMLGVSGLMPMLWRYIKEEAIDQVPDWELPVQRLSRQDIENLPSHGLSVIKFGHSSILLKIDNQLWLIDPVFSERASPFTKLGPKRFHQAPIDINELPKLDGVLISHNHYDHLDRRSIMALKDKASKFVVSLGLAKSLQAWGVASEKILELDWWQSSEIAGLKIVAAPAQHFSGRGLFDRNHTLWNSWVLQSASAKLFYSGDSGYFPGFKEIGDQYGPFDVTLMEVGAYDRSWPTVHMFPEQAVQAHLDLRGEVLIPVHNGTFDLAFHPWYEPLEKLFELAPKNNVKLVAPMVGEIFSPSQGYSQTIWWRECKTDCK